MSLQDLPRKQLRREVPYVARGAAPEMGEMAPEREHLAAEEDGKGRTARHHARLLVNLVEEARRHGLVGDRDVWKLQIVSRATRELLEFCAVDLLRIPATHAASRTVRGARVAFFEIDWLQRHFNGPDPVRFELRGVAAQMSLSRQCWSVADLADALRRQASCLERLYIRELQRGSISQLSERFPMLTDLRLLRCSVLGPTLEALVPLRKLRSLYLGECHGVHNLRGASALASLQKLRLVQLNGLTSLDGLHNSLGLRDLHLIGLESLPATDDLVTCLPQLATLKIASCPLLDLQDIGHLPTRAEAVHSIGPGPTENMGVRTSSAGGSKARGADQSAIKEEAAALERECGSFGLRAAALGYMASLYVLPATIIGSSLVRLQVNLCPIADLEALAHAPALEVLYLAYLDHLASLNGVKDCVFLQSATLKHLPAVETLDPLEKMLRLHTLRVEGCPLIKTVPSSLVCSSSLRQLEFVPVGSQGDDDGGGVLA